MRQSPEPGHSRAKCNYPIWADTTKMEKLLGSSKVSVRERVRRIFEAADQRLANLHHLLGAPED